MDEGFTLEMGNRLEVKPKFPRGIKPLLDDIREAGFIPGLWIGPFIVGNRSRSYRNHPDWVVHDRRTSGPLVQWRWVREERWHKLSEEYYILDAIHPDAFEYLRQVFHIWRPEWGCEYYKFSLESNLSINKNRSTSSVGGLWETDAPKVTRITSP